LFLTLKRKEKGKAMKSIKMSNGMPPKIVIFEANMKSSTITENLIQYSSF